ncbi:MAG: hypothetical protein BGO98_42710 [Myxococcales bacterium 68-20]|nr:hypothetical protein [Myxococcales bacterium]OJY29109.1 MAG: hypothetical protein BGO98_42710 [Myxococcales bacterium 68-20]
MLGDFYEDPLGALQKLTSEVVPRELERKAQWRMAVVGPATSTLYVSLLSALRRSQSRSLIPAELGVGGRPTSGGERMRFYSYGATLPSDAAAREAFGTGVASDGGHESVVRVIGADDELVDALFEELDARM